MHASIVRYARISTRVGLMLALMFAFLWPRARADSLDGGIDKAPIVNVAPAPGSVPDAPHPTDLVKAAIGSGAVLPAVPKDVPTDLGQSGALTELGGLLMQAIARKDYAFIAGLLLIGVIYFMRKGASYAESYKGGQHWIATIGAALNTKLGTRLLMLAGSIATGIAGALMAHVHITWSLIASAAGIAVVAAGGYDLLFSDFFDAIEKWYAAHKAAKSVSPAVAKPPANAGFAAMSAFAIMLIAVIAAITIFGYVKRAKATSIPAAKYGAVTLAATTATKIGSLVTQRTAILITNTDTANICCGSDSSVTCTTGTPIATNEKLSIGLGYLQPGQVDVWCYSTAGTAANAVKWWEIR